jgi:sugar phosphate isomerase/epimerase
MHRREFLSGALATGSTAILASGATAIDPIPRKGGPLIKLSIAAYSYRDYLTGKKLPAMTMEDYAELAAGMGLPAIEPTSYYFKDTSHAYMSKFKGHCTRLGLDVSGGAVGNRFTEPDPAKLHEEIKKTKEWTERYAILGAKTMRIFAGNAVKGEDEEVTRRRCIEAIQEVCDHAAQFGIYMALENHGGIVTTIEQMLAIVKAIKHDWFGVNFDTGNFHSADPYADLVQLAPYAVTVQIKTEIQRRDKKNEDADLGKLVGILKSANYRGYVALEYEAAADPLESIPGHIQKLKQLVQ